MADVVKDLRANGLLSEGAPSEEQIEQAATAIRNTQVGGASYRPVEMSVTSAHREQARAALTAAGVAPQEPLQRPGEYDDDFIDRGARALHETQNPWIVAHGSWAAAGHEIQQAFRESACVVLAAAGAAPQGPQALDPEKVAEALCRGIHSTRFQYRATRFACEDCSKGSRALCVAYTEGKLQ